jgi:hypothetical protein
MPNLDIHTGVQTALVITIVVIVFSFLAGGRAFVAATSLSFFACAATGWWLAGA